ncbi:hypothetical protein ACF0H5_011895 [Mactra antiquata]
MLKVLVFTILCVHIAWSADPKVKLKHTFPNTTIVNNYKTVVVEKDKDCFLSCVVDNKPAAKKVQWLVQNFNTKVTIPISTDTDTQNAFKYQIDKPAANNWRLKIQNVQESDQALYICRVQLGGQQNANDSRMISVIQKPQIIDIFTSSDTTKDVGDRLDLNCRASGIPEPIITWRMAGGGILPTGGRELTSPSIVVENVEKEFRGMYKCIAQNRAGTDVRNIYLSIRFPPTVSVNNATVFQALGHSRELTCEAYGNPPPTGNQIIWTKTGAGAELDNPNKYIQENYFGSNYVLMKLTIKDINENDYGSYRCLAENDKGSGQNTVILRQSEYYISDRPMGYNTGSLLTFSITTVVMLLATALLHCC